MPINFNEEYANQTASTSVDVSEIKQHLKTLHEDKLLFPETPDGFLLKSLRKEDYGPFVQSLIWSIRNGMNTQNSIIRKLLSTEGISSVERKWAEVEAEAERLAAERKAEWERQEAERKAEEARYEAERKAEEAR